MNRFTPAKRIESIVAHSAPVTRDIKARGAKMLAAAKVEKAKHVDEGDSFVEGKMGRTDYSVFLDDTRGLFAAMAMEFGSSSRVEVDSEGNTFVRRGTPAQRIVTGPGVRIAAGGDLDA